MGLPIGSVGRPHSGRVVVRATRARDTMAKTGLSPFLSAAELGAFDEGADVEYFKGLNVTCPLA